MTTSRRSDREIVGLGAKGGYHFGRITIAGNGGFQTGNQVNRVLGVDAHLLGEGRLDGNHTCFADGCLAHNKP